MPDPTPPEAPSERCGTCGMDSQPCACVPPEQAGKSEERWTPGEVVGFCPECREEFYVPHGGKCPAQHEGETPDLIEYVPLALLTQAEANLRNREALLSGMKAHSESQAQNIERLLARATQAEARVAELEAQIDG